MFIQAHGIQFWIKEDDISICSRDIAKYFKLSHQDVIMPAINELYEENPHAFRLFRYWDSFEYKMKKNDYSTNREGCILICKKLKVKPSLKKKFLELTDVFE